jgi:hypothetical protein
MKRREGGSRPGAAVRRVALVGVAVLILFLGAVAISPTAAQVFYVSGGPADGGCTVADTQPGTITAYVFQGSWSEGWTGSYFRLGTGGGFTGVITSVSHGGFLFQGDISEGVEVSYGGCTTAGWMLVATATYTVFGTSEPCSYIRVLPPVGKDVIETYNCDYEMEPAGVAGDLIVNYQRSCGDLWCELSTEQRTWGAVKALYR